jgi:regulator of nucleoside diphosphate kinase
MSYLGAELPPITISTRDLDRLSIIANCSMTQIPDIAEFLMREISRANIILEQHALHGLVQMGSKVVYRDETTGLQRTVTLVYPHEANIDIGRISVLTAVGAALIGLSVGQSIEFKTPSGDCRSLTVLHVDNPGYLT